MNLCVISLKFPADHSSPVPACPCGTRIGEASRRNSTLHMRHFWGLRCPKNILKINFNLLYNLDFGKSSPFGHVHQLILHLFQLLARQLRSVQWSCTRPFHRGFCWLNFLLFFNNLMKNKPEKPRIARPVASRVPPIPAAPHFCTAHAIWTMWGWRVGV